MTGSRLARWGIAFALVLFYAGGTYALTASGSPGLPTAADQGCAPTQAGRDIADATSTSTGFPATTSTSTALQPTTTTTTVATTIVEPTTTTTTTTATATLTATAAPTTTTTTETTTSLVTTTATLTATAPPSTTTTTETTTSPVTTTETTTSPVTRTETTTSPVTETQQLVRTVTATATCTVTKTVTHSIGHRPTILSLRLVHSIVRAGQPAVALVYGLPTGARVIVTITRGGRHVGIVRFQLRHGPTKLTISPTKVQTPGNYVLYFVLASGSERSRAHHLKLHVLAVSTAR